MKTPKPMVTTGQGNRTHGSSTGNMKNAEAENISYPAAPKPANILTSYPDKQNLVRT